MENKPIELYCIICQYNDSRFREKKLEKSTNNNEYMADSMPVMLARCSNSTGVKVERPLCNKCFNSTRKEWYHGVELYVLAMLRPGKLPIPIVSQISQATLCDLWTAQRIDWDCNPISHSSLFSACAYTDFTLAKFLKKAQNISHIHSLDSLFFHFFSVLAFIAISVFFYY